jgi:4-hydroxy-L-threonine phosphate dehydrogenase PdxA
VRAQPASDGGLFGDEEARVSSPQCCLASEGARVFGPPPRIRSSGARSISDAAAAPYHDVGMAAFKTVAFGGGVNVTLGLPFQNSPTTAPRSTSQGQAAPNFYRCSKRSVSGSVSRRIVLTPRWCGGNL